MRWFIALLSCLILSACGFHFSQREQLPENFSPVYVSIGNSHTPIYAMIQQTFKADGAQLATSPQGANVIFAILSDQEATMQTGAGTIQETRTYALTYTLRFQLEDKKGKLIYGPASLSSSTTEFVYSGQVLGNNQELPPAYQRLRKETIQKMLLKLSANDVQQALDSLHENQPRPTP